MFVIWRELVWFGIGHNDIAVQTAPGGPTAFNRHPTWFDDGNKVVHDPVRYSFVENTFVAECLQVHLEAFQFDANLVWDIRKQDRSIVGLAGFWANRCKFGTMVFDRKISLGAGVVEDFQQVTKRVAHVEFSSIVGYVGTTEY